jgi:hypothetical protein
MDLQTRGEGSDDLMSFRRVLLHLHDAPVLPVDLASFYGNSLQMYSVSMDYWSGRKVGLLVGGQVNRTCAVFDV